jgi:hypothetical protein
VISYQVYLYVVFILHICRCYFYFLQRAGLRYIGDLFGARALINVWEPKVNKGSQDSSSLWINIENGGGQHTDRMGAGLRVSPTLSGDAFVRFHVAWVRNAYYYLDTCYYWLYICMIRN